jgi:hypothetical protein
MENAETWKKFKIFKKLEKNPTIPKNQIKTRENGIKPTKFCQENLENI